MDSYSVEAEGDILTLTEEDYIGKGACKVTYRHPACPDRCVKIPQQLPDTDVEKELRYRAVLERCPLQPKMLTEYYGTVRTNFGKGYVYELVRDFDGQRDDAEVLAALAETRVKFK